MEQTGKLQILVVDATLIPEQIPRFAALDDRFRANVNAEFCLTCWTSMGGT
ncbi:MAG: hypothetical protein ACTSXZ_03110 [Alphaproteobacteria bacterium]